jgi:hypothetical protein
MADNIQDCGMRKEYVTHMKNESHGTTCSENALLDEYQSCDGLAKHIDKMIWQLAAVVFPIALAGLSYFGLSSTHTSSEFVIILAVAGGSIALLLAWLSLSNQWADYQKLTYYRLREIEIELGLWHYRYAVFIREPNEERKYDIAQMESNAKERFRKLDNFFGKFRHFGYTRARLMITLVFILGWVALIMREVIIIFLT